MCLMKEIAQNKDCSVVKFRWLLTMSVFSESFIETIQGKIDDILKS